MRFRLTSIFLLALAAVMLLSACTGGDSSYDQESYEESDPVTDAATTEPETESVGSVQESTAPETEPAALF